MDSNREKREREAGQSQRDESLMGWSKGLSTVSNRTGLSRDDGVSKKVSKTQSKEDKRVEEEKNSREDMEYAWVSDTISNILPGANANEPAKTRELDSFLD